MTDSLQPRNTNLTELTGRPTTFTTRVETLEQRPASSSANTATDNALAKTVQRQQALLEKLDPANKAVVFVGFPRTVTAKQRTSYLQDDLRSQDLVLTYANIDSIYQGPWNERTLTKVAFVEFHSNTQREDFLKPRKDEKITLTLPENSTATLRLDRKKTNRQRQRNYSLRHAKELLEKHFENKGATAKLNWQLTDSTSKKSNRNRMVTVNDTPAFTQTPPDLTGTLSPHALLTASIYSNPTITASTTMTTATMATTMAVATTTSAAATAGTTATNTNSSNNRQ